MRGGVRTEIHQTGADDGGASFLFVDHPPAEHRHRPRPRPCAARALEQARAILDAMAGGVRAHLATIGALLDAVASDDDDGAERRTSVSRGSGRP